jgi:hypothetical protein
MTALLWPFSRIWAGRSRPTPFVAMHGPLCTVNAVTYFQSIRHSYRFIGFTSHVDFPRSYRHRSDLVWLGACEGWCHCFRDPSQYLPSGLPSALISYSDFVDCRPQFPIKSPKHYDLGFVCPAGKWKEYTKNWDLALRCLTSLLSAQPEFKTIVIGREQTPDMPDQVTFFPQLEHQRLLEVLSTCRCVLFTGILDASPRLIPECLCLDVPVAVNWNILGGWKYINRYTGRFFYDEYSVSSAVENCIAHCESPSRWYFANYGPHLSGRRLARFLTRLEPNFVERHVYIEDWRNPRGCEEEADELP